MMKVKYYKCPICNSKYKTLTGWGDHMHALHPNEIPEGYSDSRYFYYTKTGKTHGNCRTCKKPTEWNEESQKYNQYCNNPACKQAYVKIAKQRMINQYGKVHLLNDPDMQRKMVQHRKISGTYRMQDGGKIGYTGKLEKKFLEMLDSMFEWPSADIMSPSPHTYYYEYHNEKDPDVQSDRKFYIPDFYIPSLNLEVEIEQTTSGNQKMMDVYKVKKEQKEEIMKKNHHVRYVKVSDNDFTSFFDFLLKIRENGTPDDSVMDVVNESFLPVMENPNPDLDVVKTIENCAKENGITLKISKEGDWGLNQWLNGGECLFLVGCCPNIHSAIKTLKTCINDNHYKLKIDGYNTIFLEREKSSGLETDTVIIPHQSPAMEEANYSKENCYPVYIVLMHSGTILSNIIQKFTHDEFSHACISFNPNLTPMYSFGNKKVGCVDAGFTIQSPASEFFTVKKARYKVYVMYVNQESYQKMKENLDEFIKDRLTLKYALLDLLKVWRGKPSEDSKKFFCSRFVMAVIGAGRKLDKVASLYKPQDIAELEDITCVNQGDDLSKYDVKITEKNLKKVQKKQFSSIVFEELLTICGLGSPNDIALESMFSMDSEEKNGILYQKIQQWKNILFGSKNLMGSTKGHSSNKLFGPFVAVEKGFIIIRGINYALLRNRITDFYRDRSVNNIFLPIYDAASFRRFERKKIQRSEIKIDYMETPVFFALELSKLFSELGEWYNDKRYLTIANLVYKRTWLKETDGKSLHVSQLNTSILKDAFNMPLLPHQNAFVERYPILKAQLNLRGYILAFKQGLGKTITSIALAECLDVDHVYIVCPNTSSMKTVWRNEIKKYLRRYNDYDTFLSEVMICDDKTACYHKDRTKYFIINNESIPKMYPYITEGKNMLIVDESHNFRKLGGKRVNDLIELRERIDPTDILCMSGTPIKATPSEISPVLRLIDPTFTDEVGEIYNHAFNVHHEIALSLVKSRFGRIMLRESKEVLGSSLPPKEEKDLSLTISESSRYTVSYVMSLVFEKYTEIFQKGKKEAESLRDEFYEYIGKFMPRTYDRNRFTNLAISMAVQEAIPQMHEVDIDFMNNAVRDTKSAIKDREKQKRFEFLVKNYLRYNLHCRGIAFGQIMPKYRNDCFIDLFDQNKDLIIRLIKESPTKTLIFSQFRKVATYIYNTLAEAGIGAVLITGEVHDRIPIISQFKENDSVTVMVATPKTLGVGVTLTEASNVFFFGPPWRHADYEQCSDRVHRIGQTRPVTIYNVVLETGGELNLTGRMQDILEWSKKMVGEVVNTEVNKTEDDEFIDEVLVANESTTNLDEIKEFFDVQSVILEQSDTLIELPENLQNRAFRFEEGFNFMKAIANVSIPKGVIIDNNAIMIPEGREQEFRNLVWSNLGTACFSQISDPESNANVKFSEYIKNGRPHWRLVTIKKIKKGSMITYHPHSSDMTFSKDLE